MKIVFGLLLGLCLSWASGAPAQAALSNRLAGHASPYLALHGADPVHWQEWGPAALKQARALNRPLFLSSGYFACHWCHVMQRESFRDPAIAKLLNRHFIPVKVDRELHPALDDRLMAFANETRGSAGWPLNVFLTPAGHPFLANAYLPPAAFRDWIARVAGVWEQKAEELTRLAREASEFTDQQPSEWRALNLSPAALELRFTQSALTMTNELEGGFGDQSRFPMAPQWLAVLEIQTRNPKPALERALTLTLDQMAGKGLRDHLDGGFFRYTTDPGWSTPHFEKMLYTQALQARLFLRAAEVLNRPEYREPARDTLAFVERAMRHPEGGYVASLSAVDHQDREGGGYLWSAAELQAALDPADRPLALAYWQLAGPPLFEGGRLPIPRADPAAMAEGLGLSPEALAKRLPSMRDRLLAQRPPHPRDGKRISAWNGLLLQALSEAAGTFSEFKAPADRLARRLLRLRQADGGIPRTFDGTTPGALEDYAYLAAGLQRWSLLAGSAAGRKRALEIAHEGWRRFWDGTTWSQAEGDGGLPGGRQAAIGDGPMPSPAAVLIRLSLDSPDPQLTAKARQALAKARPLAERDPFWYPGYIEPLL